MCRWVETHGQASLQAGQCAGSSVPNPQFPVQKPEKNALVGHGLFRIGLKDNAFSLTGNGQRPVCVLREPAHAGRRLCITRSFYPVNMIGWRRKRLSLNRTLLSFGLRGNSRIFAA